MMNTKTAQVRPEVEKLRKLVNRYRTYDHPAVQAQLAKLRAKEAQS